jgi:hypothetical protein
MFKVAIFFSLLMSAQGLFADAEQDRIDAVKREDQRVEDQRLEKNRVEQQIQDQQQESRRLEDQRVQRKIDDDRWDRQHGR